MPAVRGRALRPLRSAAVGVVLLALGACGADDSALAAGPTSALRERVAAVRAAATTGDAAGARSALDAFRAQVHRLVETGELDPADAVDLLAHADRVGSGLRAGPPPARTRDRISERDQRGNHDDDEH